MSFTVPTFEQIRTQYLQALLNQNPAAAVGPDSDHFVRASAIAAVLEGVYSHQAWVFRQAFPDMADADYMEKMANQRGLTRKLTPIDGEGVDRESDADLLARLLLELSEVAQGGTALDYERWARSVPGVSRAYVFPLRRGLGTVDVVPMPPSGLPGAPLLASVQTVLDARRPVGMVAGSGVLALAPTPLATAVTASLTLAAGTTLAGVTAAVQGAIAAVFAQLEPGDALVRNRLITAMLNVTGVTDVTLSLPATNVTSSVGPTALELVTPGAVTLS